MDLLYGPDLQLEVFKAAQSAHKIWLVSGFLKSGFMDRIGIPANCDLRVCSRWRLADLATGSSDVVAASEVVNRGGLFAIHPRVHAKVFLFDDLVFVGSANLTASGLPTSEGAGNLEACVRIQSSSAAVNFIEHTFQNAVPLNSDLILKISDEVEDLQAKMEQQLPEIMNQMPSAFEEEVEKSQLQPLTGADFPWCRNTAELIIGEPEEELVSHDLELFSLRPHPTKSEISTAFLSSRCYCWLRSQTETETRFGALSAKLHDSLHGDPRPYRREVKQLLENLVNWASECDPENFRTARHSYTRSFHHQLSDK